MILQSLAGLPASWCILTGVVAVMAYLLVYTRVTPHNEFKLIRDNDPAAAVALGSAWSASCCRWSAPSPIPPMSGTA